MASTGIKKSYISISMCINKLCNFQIFFQGQLICLICPHYPRFPNPLQFGRHKKIHKSNHSGNHKCQWCSRTFVGKYLFKTHLYQAHKKQLYEVRKNSAYRCTLCDVTVAGMYEFENHVVKNHCAA